MQVPDTVGIVGLSMILARDRLKLESRRQQRAIT